MDHARIRELLAPFLEGEELPSNQLAQFATYLALLLKWNARMNLTAVRAPEKIVTRHFGESVFTARKLFPNREAATLIDVGSGAGFPGMPIGIVRPAVEVTLLEAHGKKATFLKEVTRTLELKNLKVANVRVENYGEQADVVTFRAVEHFQQILPVSATLVKTAGRLAVLLGSGQDIDYKEFNEDCWAPSQSVNFPDSPGRVLWIAHKIMDN